MRPKARGLVQHGGPPGWLEESDPAGCDFECDVRSMTDYTTCPEIEFMKVQFIEVSGNNIEITQT